MLIRVKAFGLNRSELHFRQGRGDQRHVSAGSGHRGDGDRRRRTRWRVPPGTQVVTMMGGMGRAFDGGYAEYVLVPAAQVIAFPSDLPWEQLGARAGDAADRVRVVVDRRRQGRGC